MNNFTKLAGMRIAGWGPGTILAPVRMGALAQKNEGGRNNTGVVPASAPGPTTKGHLIVRGWIDSPV